jgi:peroxiredoxin (alkyl hydroperoxide reductase subunit C)
MVQVMARIQPAASVNRPAPADDGQSAHLKGLRLPAIALRSTGPETVRLSEIEGRSVVFIYVRTRIPGQPALYDHWDTIPGAAGCTVEACGFRDHYLDFLRLNTRVFGLSADDPARQREAARRLNLPFPLLSDAQFNFALPLCLPVFEVNEHTFLKRTTLVVCNGVIEHVFYPVFPANSHSEAVLDWLRSNPFK